MAEAISIPSPSVFLRASPSPDAKAQQSTSTSERKRSTSKKQKKTTTAPTKAVENAAVSKPKQSKSRNGCVTCKNKRLKCDETKPSCQQCKRRSVECGGYKKDFKWRPFEETNVATNITKRKKASSPAPASSSHPGLSGEETALFPSCSHYDGKETSKSPIDEVSPSFAQQVFISPEGNNNIDPALRAENAISSTDEALANASGGSTASDNVETKEDLLDVAGASNDRGLTDGVVEATDASQSLPDLIELVGNIEGIRSVPEFAEFDAGDTDFMLDPFDLPMFMQDVMDHNYTMDIEDIPQIPTTTPDYDAWALRLASRPLTAENEYMKGSERGISGPFTYLYEQPFLPQTSPEMLALRFDRLTCGILSVKDGPNENPWRTLIWPMAKRSPALYHAVSAMTAFHSSRDVPALRLIGHEHKSASLQILATGINEGTMNHDTAIATTLALAFAECWDQHISSGNDHIKGARVMMNIALDRHRAMPLTGEKLAILKFLCNAWVYLDVLARVTTVDDDESDDYDKLYCLYSDQSRDCDLGFGIDFGMPIDAQLDPLMGCASTLFPLIGRVANLVRRVCRSDSNTPPMISQGMELQLALQTWDPPEFIEPPEDLTSNVQHSIQTAEAYRWATLLYLHQALPEIPGPSSADLAKKVLVFLATVPLASRTVIVHIYPLMMAGCEVTSSEEREWVKDRWAALSQRMRIGPIDKCMDVTKEVWRRRDEHESQPVLRRPLVATSNLRSSGTTRPSGGDRAGSHESPLGGTFGRIQGRRRPTSADIDSHMSLQRPRSESNGGLDPLYTVKGRLHWVGVMMDWGWEGAYNRPSSRRGYT